MIFEKNFRIIEIDSFVNLEVQKMHRQMDCFLISLKFEVIYFYGHRLCYLEILQFDHTLRGQL